MYSFSFQCARLEDETQCKAFTFYPIYEFVKHVGGDKVAVTSIIPVGVEPHDFEPTIEQIQDAEGADIVE